MGAQSFALAFVLAIAERSEVSVPAFVRGPDTLIRASPVALPPILGQRLRAALGVAPRGRNVGLGDSGAYFVPAGAQLLS